MWAHLFTKSVKEPPQDYVDLWLCRDIYKCPPDVLDRQNAVRVFKHLNIIQAEQDIEDFKNRSKPKKKNANV